jgi:hypothetical protein
MISYCNGLLKWTYKLQSGFYIDIQMNIFLLWFHLNIFFRNSIYDAWWGKKIDWKKLQQKV